MENKDIDKAAKGKCTLSDAELIEKSHAIIRDTSATYGKAWRMSIPPMPNHDSDFILSELVGRFMSHQSEIDELKSDIEKYKTESQEFKERLRISYKITEDKRVEMERLIEAVEEMRWIPVSERLPEVGKSGISKEVIADCPSVYKTLHYCKNSYYPNGAWFCASEELQSYPTHWRPIDTPKATQLLEKYGKK